MLVSYPGVWHMSDTFDKAVSDDEDPDLDLPFLLLLSAVGDRCREAKSWLLPYSPTAGGCR